MEEYGNLMADGKHAEAFDKIARECNRILEQVMKKDQTVCIMAEDPDNLGASLICHFLISLTKGKTKVMKQYSAQRAIELVKDRRM